MLGLVGSIIFGMLDPIIAGGGILTGYLWGRRSWWALLPLGLTIGFLIQLHVQMAFEMQSNREAFFAFTQSCSTLLWASLTMLFVRRMRKPAVAAPALERQEQP